MTFFSMVRKDEANQQKGDKYTLRVKFSGQKGPARRLDVYRRYREEVPGLVPLPGRSAGPEMLLWPD